VDRDIFAELCRLSQTREEGLGGDGWLHERQLLEGRDLPAATDVGALLEIQALIGGRIAGALRSRTRHGQEPQRERGPNPPS
jgi:hypothetical protein